MVYLSLFQNAYSRLYPTPFIMNRIIYDVVRVNVAAVCDLMDETY